MRRFNEVMDLFSVILVIFANVAFFLSPFHSAQSDSSQLCR